MKTETPTRRLSVRTDKDLRFPSELNGHATNGSEPMTVPETGRPQRKRGRIAVVRHGEFFQPHPRRDIFALRDAGFDVDVICDSEPGKPHLEHVEGVTVIRLPIRHKRGRIGRYLFEYMAFPLLAAGALALLSVRGRYDYVEIDTMPTWLIVAAVVPKLLGATVVLYMFEHMAELTATDRGLTESHWLIRLIDSIEMACVRSADRVITPAERNRELYISRGIEADKIVFIPNCPDENVFVPPSFEFPRPSRNDNEFRLITHGSLLERYGIQILITAVNQLRVRIPGIRLEIIGSGEYEADLQSQANELGLADIVTFTGIVAFGQMAERLLSADVGVGPYLLDLLPNKMMEYLLLGIPAIAADWPTMRRYFGDDIVSYVRPNDAEALATAIEAMYDDPEGRAAQAARARDRYLKSLAWSRTKQDYLAIYNAAPLRAPKEVVKAEPTPDLPQTERRSWLRFVLGQSRGPRNALKRLPTIVERFGVTPSKSVGHLDALLDVTDRHGVTPTLLVTGVTARRNPDVILNLHKRGVEIGAHGFVHNDYSALSEAEQREQVGRARDELAALGIRARGWRCPYSRMNEFTLPAVKHARFEYEATPVFEWPAFEATGVEMSDGARADYDRLCRLFGVQDARTRAVLPRLIAGIVQIPMSIPQDEDMIDRLDLSPVQLEKVWVWMVEESRRRREAFVICLHPERAELMASALDATLRRGRELDDVWMVPLIEISNWWNERSEAKVSVQPAKGASSWSVAVTASDRVAIAHGEQMLTGSGRITVKSDKKPVIGGSNLWPDSTKHRITDAGFIFEEGDSDSVELYLDSLFTPVSIRTRSCEDYPKSKALLEFSPGRRASGHASA